MAAEAETGPRSIAAAAAVSKAGRSTAGRWRSEEGKVASGRRMVGAGLVRKRAGPGRNEAGLRSRGRSLEEGHCGEERIPAQQG